MNQCYRLTPQAKSRLLTGAHILTGAALAALVESTVPGGMPRAKVARLDTLLEWPSWLNGRPTTDDIVGNVVVVNVFTFDCTNCQNVTQNLRALRDRKGPELSIIGIHCPETPHERERNQLVRRLSQLGVTWPVAIDNDFTLWKAFDVENWPTQLLFGRSGTLERVVVGDDQDAAVNATVNSLLRVSCSLQKDRATPAEASSVIA